MTKPMNFPERVNQRRKTALARTLKSFSYRRNPEAPAHKKARVMVKNLENKISESSLRDVRTKKLIGYTR